MKLAVIGGGSTYTPELADGLGRLAPQVTELVLVDPDEARLAVVGPVSARIMRAHGHQARVRWTTDAEDGVDGAAAGLLQLRVGGQAARELARRRAAPGAWLIDFTNPVGMVTRALLDDGHRAVGLCNVAIGLQRYFAGLLGVPPESVSLDHVGLNHLTWERAVRVDGADKLPELLAAHLEEIADHVDSPATVLSSYSFVPSYYLRYYYLHDSVAAEQKQTGTRAAAVAAIEAELLRMYADPALDSKPELLGKRGGALYSEAAVALLASLIGDIGDVQVVNVRNDGTFGFLADEAVIGVPAVVGSGGAAPVPTAPLSPLLRGLVAHMSAYEELAVDAALLGGRPRVVSALLAHPLIGQYDLAEKMADRLIAENARFLPWA
jgi:6-phospho-beta-glucosidase